MPEEIQIGRTMSTATHGLNRGRCLHSRARTMAIPVRVCPVRTRVCEESMIFRNGLAVPRMVRGLATATFYSHILVEYIDTLSFRFAL
jgi:hypothetical protein